MSKPGQILTTIFSIGIQGLHIARLFLFVNRSSQYERDPFYYMIRFKLFQKFYCLKLARMEKKNVGKFFGYFLSSKFFLTLFYRIKKKIEHTFQTILRRIFFWRKCQTFFLKTFSSEIFFFKNSFLSDSYINFGMTRVTFV